MMFSNYGKLTKQIVDNFRTFENIKNILYQKNSCYI